MSPDRSLTGPMESIREGFAKLIMHTAGINDARLEAAFASVERERFLGPQPWSIVHIDGSRELLGMVDPSIAYRDVIFAINPDKGINSGLPSFHAKLLSALDVKPASLVLHVGCGYGYYSAVLAHLVGPRGHVVAVEIDPTLADMARIYLRSYNNVTVVAADAARLQVTNLDAVYINFAVSDIASPWIDNLNVGGRVLIPLGTPSIWRLTGRSYYSNQGAAFVIEKLTQGFSAKWVCPAFFVYAEGDLSVMRAPHLESAFSRGGQEFVRSFHWKMTAPPQKSWAWTSRWALSFDEPN